MNPVFTSNENKSRELEYLITRGLAPETELAHALVETEYPRLHWLAALLTSSSTDARRIVVEALAGYLSSARAHSADASLSAWVERAVVRAARKQFSAAAAPQPDKPAHSNIAPSPVAPVDSAIWQAFDRLGAARLPLLMTLLLGRSISDLAYRLDEKSENIRGRLEASWDRLRLELEDSPDVETGYTAPPLQDTVSDSLSRRWPVLSVEEDPARLAAEILEAHQRGKSRGRLGQVRGYAVFAILAVLSAVFLFRFGDQLFPSDFEPTPGSETIVVTATSRRPAPTRTPAPTAPPPEPLTLNSSPAEVHERILSSASTWQTLWADALVVHYGPPGYIGPPAVYRNQVWIEQPDRALTLAGPRAGSANSVWSMQGSSSFGVDLRSGMVFYERDQLPAQSSEILPFIPVTGPAAPQGKSLAGFYLSSLLFPDQAGLPGGDIDIQAVEQVAGRSTLVVDWVPYGERTSTREWVDALTGAVLHWAPAGNLNPARLWVDAITGVVLRWRTFSAAVPDLVIQDLILTETAFDFEFPDNFFDPRSLRNGSLVWGAMWRPDLPPGSGTTDWGIPPVRERLQRARPPRDLDRSRETITLQWPLRANPETRSNSDAELFAGSYFIGEVNMEDPWKLQCQRSPDGRLIAFVPDSLPSLDPSFELHWFRVDHTGQLFTTLTGDRTSADYAFSPDSSQLAFHGCNLAGDCAVYLMDTTSRKNVTLFSVDNAGWFAWSPNGKSLAFVGLGGRSFKDRVWRLTVMDVETGVVVNAVPFPMDSRELPEESIVADWGIPYPPSQPGIEGCLASPTRQSQAFSSIEAPNSTP